MNCTNAVWGLSVHFLIWKNQKQSDLPMKCWNFISSVIIENSKRKQRQSHLSWFPFSFLLFISWDRETKRYPPQDLQALILSSAMQDLRCTMCTRGHLWEVQVDLWTQTQAFSYGSHVTQQRPYYLCHHSQTFFLPASLFSSHCFSLAV